MAIENVHLRNGDRSLYDNETRREWSRKIGGVMALDEAVRMLVEFRGKNVGVERHSFELENDALWIEAEMERRVSQLRKKKFSGASLLKKCVCGTDGEKVLKEKKAEVDAVGTDLMRLEALAAEYRRTLKAPIMPVNYWLALDSHVSRRLLEARATVVDVAELDVDEWRDKRGFKTLEAGHGNAMH